MIKRKKLSISSGSKLHNIPVVARDGYRYASKLEANVARDLEWRRKAGELVQIERQVRIKLHAHGKFICYYIIDLIAYRKDGIKEYIEAKGFATDVWRLKWNLFQAQIQVEEPTAILRIIKKS